MERSYTKEQIARFIVNHRPDLCTFSEEEIIIALQEWTDQMEADKIDLDD